MSLSKLSLLVKFDDLVRNTAVLTQGLEGDFISFVKHQENCRVMWQAAEAELEKLRSMLSRVEAEKDSLELKLKHARQQIQTEMDRRCRVEAERENMDRQMTLIREIMNDRNKSMLTQQERERLSFLTSFSHTGFNDRISPKKNLDTIDETASLLSPSEIDRTEESDEENCRRNGTKWDRHSPRYGPSSHVPLQKKRSVPTAPPLEDITPPKRKKSNEEEAVIKAHDSIVATTTITMPEDGPIKAVSEIKAGAAPTRLNRSFSEPGLPQLARAERFEDSDSDDSFFGVGKAASTANTPANKLFKSPKMQRWNSAGKGLNRQHAFASKTVIKPETCMPCGKRIKFGKLALKCKDCRATCHPNHRDDVPLPCIASCTTPTSVGMVGTIADFVPPTEPMVPGIIVHCVREIEHRGFNEVGLYRVPGSEKEVRDLKDAFLRGRGVPNLSRIIDINVICGCVKLFFRTLKEPLLTYKLWNFFVEASQKEHDTQLYHAINQLPQPNRDTLAYMMLHLQKVSECPAVKMTVSNLAKVFGPTIVGFSGPNLEPMAMMTETVKQAGVMESLLKLPRSYWFNYIGDDEDVHDRGDNNNRGRRDHNNEESPQLLHTPESRPAPALTSMLGPVDTPSQMTPSKSTSTLGQRAKSVFNTPRFGSKSGRTPRQFFASPMLN